MKQTLFILGAGIISAVAATKGEEANCGIKIPAISESDFDCFNTYNAPTIKDKACDSPSTCGNDTGIVASGSSGCGDQAGSVGSAGSQSGSVAIANSNSNTSATAVANGNNGANGGYGNNGNVAAGNNAQIGDNDFNGNNLEDDCFGEEATVAAPTRYTTVNGKRVETSAYKAWAKKQQANKQNLTSAAQNSNTAAAKIDRSNSSSDLSATKGGQLKNEDAMENASSNLKKNTSSDKVQRGFRRQNEEKGLATEKECVENGEMNLGFEKSGNHKLIDNVSGCEEKIVHEEVIKDCNCNEKVNRKVWLKKHLDKKHLKQEEGSCNKDTRIKQTGANKNGLMRKHRTAGQGARFHSCNDEASKDMECESKSARNEIKKQDFDNFGAQKRANADASDNSQVQVNKRLYSANQENSDEDANSNDNAQDNSNDQNENETSVAAPRVANNDC